MAIVCRCFWKVLIIVGGVGGGKCIGWEDPLGQYVFEQGIRGGVAIQEMVSEKHFFDVEESFVVSI